MLYDILVQIFMFSAGYFTAKLIFAKNFIEFLRELKDDTKNRIIADINRKV